MFIVRVIRDVREAGQDFGPFEKRQDAEKCVLVVAARPDVQSATVIEETK